MAKQKVSDLPKEEQEKLIAQMKELNIRGVYPTFSVEKAQELIKKAQEQQNGSGEHENDGQNADENAGSDDAAQNDEQGEENDSEDQKDGDEQENDENADTDADKKGTDEEKAEENKAQKNDAPKTQPKEKKETKVLRCHICLSPVVNGKCTGCGFELN